MRFVKIGFICLMIVVLGLSGCGENQSPGPNPNIPLPRVLAEDSAIQIKGLNYWNIIGNDLTPGVDTLFLKLQGLSDSMPIAAFLNSEFHSLGDADEIIIDISSLSPGKHQLMFALENSDTAFAVREFIKTYPIYVTLSSDWDYPSIMENRLTNQIALHSLHEEVKITHFVGPYTFTDTVFFKENEYNEMLTPKEIVSLLLDWEKEYGAEIGLHIHPYCNFVEAAGLACNKDSVFSQNPELPGDGYNVGCDAYTEEGFYTLLKFADSLFLANGLNKPRSFRAGGWTAKEHTLKALQKAGYWVDASACNVTRMDEELRNEWLDSYWGFVTDTTQPYYPGIGQIGAQKKPLIGILEIPNNALFVDYVTSDDEMIEIFNANLSDSVFDAPRQVSYGYHTNALSLEDFETFASALAHVNEYLLSEDKGPVVYATMSELTKVWVKPN